MKKHKLRIGKNPNGWFLAIPKWWGGYDVIEGLPTHDRAVALAEHYLNGPGAIWS